MSDLGRMLISFGVLLVIAGLVVSWLPGLFSGGFRMPGDIVIRRGSFTFYFPLATSLLISILLTLIFQFFRR